MDVKELPASIVGLERFVGLEPPLLVPIQIKMALSRTPLFEGFDAEDLDRAMAWRPATQVRFRTNLARLVEDRQ